MQHRVVPLPPMADLEKDERISVPISYADRQRLRKRADVLGNSEAGLAALILHRGLDRVGELVKDELDALDREEGEA